MKYTCDQGLFPAIGYICTNGIITKIQSMSVNQNYTTSIMGLKMTLLFMFLLGVMSSCTSEAEEHSTTIRVMTYNIHHANPPSQPDSIDIEAITRVIRNENPDLVALQEVDVFTQRSGTELHQAREIARRLDMHCYFGKALDYQGGYYGNAVLSRYPILDSTVFELPPMEGVEAEVRNWTGIKISIEGNEMWFGSTHLDFQRGENNLDQSRRLVQHLEKIELPIIIGGDFNRTPDSETMAFFSDHFQLTCSDCPPTIPVTDPNRTIDHVIYRPKERFTVAEHRVVDEQYASDHLPVIAVLEWQKK